MQHQPPYINLTNKRAWKKFRKLLRKIQFLLQKNTFSRLPYFHQRRLIYQLKKYLNRFSKKNFATKKVAIGTSLLLMLVAPNKGKSQIYVQPPCSNSLGFVDVGNNAYPVFTDIDGDGDQDAFIGNEDGEVKFFRNTGSTTSPNFVEEIGVNNPLSTIDVGSNAVPVFVDIDNDGDFDVFIGDFSGNIEFHRNDGTSNTPSFTPITGINNPFDGIDIGTFSAPNFVDIDNDGDLDAFVSGNSASGGIINFFRNDGTISSPNFTLLTGIDNPLSGITIGANPLTSFIDQDKDGDLDVFIASQLGMIQYFENIGSANSPNYSPVLGTDNPLSGLDVGRNGAIIPNPCFVDINGDGNMDFFIGSRDGTINFFENNPNIDCDNPVFEKIMDQNNPANGIDIGENAAPDFVDIDNDGDADLFIGNDDGEISFFKNEGSPEIPVFVEVTGANNPFNGVDIGDIATISFVDIDNDGLVDAFIGEEDGLINYFKNTGSPTLPNFVEVSGIGNPFDGIDIGDQSSPTFADIDNDGDLDAFIGNKNGMIHFFRNEGTATTPTFIEYNDFTNPFFGVDLEEKFTPAFGDIDNDGDLDAIIGNKSGTLYYFRNDGTATQAKFVGLYGDCNPFNNLLPIFSNENEFSFPTLVDIDNDGELDIFSGQFGGQLCFLQKNIQEVAERDIVPTLNQWGLTIFGLLILNISLLFLERFKKISDLLTRDS